MLSELAFPHIRCCLSAIPLDLMKSTAVDESLSSMNQQFCSRENQLLLISSYSFNLYYMKGKDMILSDFLSRQRNNDSNPNEIIPISFDMHQVLENNFYLENFCADKYLIQT